MKRYSTLFLRVALIGMGGFILFLCILLFPAFLHESNYEFRPIVTGLYVAALPFYYALYQAWKLLGLIDRKMAFSGRAVQALKMVKYSALTITILFIGYLPLLMGLAQYEDAPGIFALGLMIVALSSVITVFTALLQALFQSAIDIKSENDLTV